ncbi:MAG: hypothetical protein HC835_03840 [Oscillatoriales cyanobacterium RM2_1_1]|nr:hypothetical protein [Oscillatoriales cyanobacterium SM2_3_0]NJO44817.1 hypothetical protein [Oscillatoriales cyanobacterium RM2_1_1]
MMNKVFSSIAATSLIVGSVLAGNGVANAVAIDGRATFSTTASLSAGLVDFDTPDLLAFLVNDGFADITQATVLSDLDLVGTPVTDNPFIQFAGGSGDDQGVMNVLSFEGGGTPIQVAQNVAIPYSFSVSYLTEDGEASDGQFILTAQFTNANADDILAALENGEVLDTVAISGTIDAFADEPPIEQIPESSNILGILALGVFGASVTLKRRA